MPKTKIATMEEFATVANVSRPSLSKYFHAADSVSDRIRVRIEEALQVYDYRPNIFAINQNRASSKTIGIVVPYLADPFFAEMVRKIERLCIEAGYWPVLFSSHGKTSLETDALATLQALKPAGALIAPLGRASEAAVLTEFCDAVPTVVFDSNAEVGRAFVGLDNMQSMGVMVNHLCDTGEAPCFVEMPPVNPNARRRRTAYIRAMEARGLEPQVVKIGGQSWQMEKVGLEEGKRLIREKALPSTTVLCSNDRIAIGFLSAAYEMGLRVGRGHGCALRLAGHDDHPWSRYTCPPLTTMAQDYDAITRISVERLFAILDEDGESAGHESAERDETLLAGTLIVRESA